MELTDVTLRLLLLFFPGFISALLFRGLTEYEDKGLSYFLVQAFVLGLGSYVLLAVIAAVLSVVRTTWLDGTPIQLAFFDSVTAQRPVIAWPEILGATVAGIVLSAFLAVASDRKWLHKAARKMGITRLSGELDIWAYTLKDVEWVVVRDHETDLAYEGWVHGYSISSRRPEILLKEVRVYRNASGEFLYSVPVVDDATAAENLCIEVPGSGYETPQTRESEDYGEERE